MIKAIAQGFCIGVGCATAVVVTCWLVVATVTR